ncbi:MAG: UTRA domain-containing protein [Anaerolineales bacterium]|nr:UTRA domain-containing protein [Anaerolineales bacterium]
MTTETQSKSDDNKRRPLYQQTAEVLEKLLEEMEPGDFLPSEPALARQIGVSRATLREAMRSFEERGLILRQQGVGTSVRREPQMIETGLEVLESVLTLASRNDLEIDLDDLTIGERQPTKVESELFKIDATTPVIEVSRVLNVDGHPVTYLIDVIPKDLIPQEVMEEDFKGSVLDVLLVRGEPVLSHSRTEITAMAASAEIARRLKIRQGDVLLVLEAWLCTQDGNSIDHSLSYFLPGTFRFHVVRRVG